MNSRIIFAGNLSLVIALKPYDYITNINNSGTGRLVLVALAFITTSYLVDEVFFNNDLADDRFFEALTISAYY